VSLSPYVSITRRSVMPACSPHITPRRGLFCLHAHPILPLVEVCSACMLTPYYPSWRSVMPACSPNVSPRGGLLCLHAENCIDTQSLLAACSPNVSPPHVEAYCAFMLRTVLTHRVCWLHAHPMLALVEAYCAFMLRTVLTHRVCWLRRSWKLVRTTASQLMRRAPRSDATF
jgi:hypothetical protein